MMSSISGILFIYCFEKIRKILFHFLGYKFYIFLQIYLSHFLMAGVLIISLEYWQKLFKVILCNMNNDLDNSILQEDWVEWYLQYWFREEALGLLRNPTRTDDEIQLWIQDVLKWTDGQNFAGVWLWNAIRSLWKRHSTRVRRILISLLNKINDTSSTVWDITVAHRVAKIFPYHEIGKKLKWQIAAILETTVKQGQQERERLNTIDRRGNYLWISACHLLWQLRSWDGAYCKMLIGFADAINDRHFLDTLTIDIATNNPDELTEALIKKATSGLDEWGKRQFLYNVWMILPTDKKTEIEEKLWLEFSHR